MDGDYRCDSQRSGHVGLERWKFLQLQSGLGEQPPNNEHRPGEQDFNLSRITSFLQKKDGYSMSSNYENDRLMQMDWYN